MENELLDNTIQDMEYVGDIPEGWKWVKLGEIADIKMGQSPESKYYNDKGIGLPFLQGSKTFGYKYPEVEIYCSNPIKVAKKGEILISVRAPVGDINIASQDICIGRGIASINSLFNQNEFLFYYLKHSKNDLLASESGTVFGSINKETLYNFPILLPPLPEQKAIAEVLSSIDDKIELLHRQNKTLEEMAMTLFRQWFIDANFDGTICQIVNVQGGYAFKSKDFKLNGNHSVIKIKNITNSIVNINDTEFIDESVVENLDTRFKISSGDVLIAMTGAEIGKLGIVPKTNKNLWLNQRVGLLREKYDGARFIAYLHLKSEFGYDYIINAASGSAQANISASDIENCPFVQLSEDEIKAYSKTITPFFEKIIFNLGQIQTLEKLRDTLLPKLMSGEIRVKI